MAKSFAPSIIRLLTFSFFLGFGLSSCSGGDQADEPVQAEDGIAADDEAVSQQQEAAQQEQPLVADDSAPMGSDSGLPESAGDSAPKEEDIVTDDPAPPPAMVDSASDTVNAELTTDAPATPPAATDTADAADTPPENLATNFEESAPSAVTEAMPSAPGTTVSSPGAAKFVKGKHDDQHAQHAKKGTAAAAAMASSGGGDASYVIQPGDTLARIAEKIYGSYKQWTSLASMNGINAPYRIFPGHELTYDTSNPKAAAFAKSYQAGMKTVVVEKGDTLSRIAEKLYGSTAAWKQLANYNKGRLSDPNRITVGMKLFYVEKEGMAAATASSPKADVVKTQKTSPMKQTVHKAPKKTPKTAKVGKMGGKSAKKGKAKKAPISAEDLAE